MKGAFRPVRGAAALAQRALLGALALALTSAPVHAALDFTAPTFEPYRYAKESVARAGSFPGSGADAARTFYPLESRTGGGFDLRFEAGIAIPATHTGTLRVTLTDMAFADTVSADHGLVLVSGGNRGDTSATLSTTAALAETTPITLDIGSSDTLGVSSAHSAGIRIEVVNATLEARGAGHARATLAQPAAVVGVPGLETSVTSPTRTARVRAGFEAFDDAGRHRAATVGSVARRLATSTPESGMYTAARVKLLGNLSFVEKVTLLAADLAKGSAERCGNGTDWPVARGATMTAELPLGSAFPLGTKRFICLQARAGTPIPRSSYRVSIDYEPVSQRVSPIADLRVEAGSIGRDGTTIHIPFVTTYSGYEHNLIIENEGPAAPYEFTFQPEECVRARAGAMARGTLAKGTTYLGASELVTLSGGKRTAATFTSEARAGSIRMASLLLTRGKRETDLVVLRPEGSGGVDSTGGLESIAPQGPRAAPVSNFRVLATTADSITLGWDAPASTAGLAGFVLESYRSAADCASPTRVATLAASATSHTVTGLAAGTPYHYGITARAKADSDYRDSEPTVITTSTTSKTPLEAVRNFRATATTDTTITLGWDSLGSTSGPSPYIADVLIESCPSASSCTGPTQVATAAASATSHTVTGLTAGTSYHYRITARATADSDYRDSEPSAILTVTTSSDKTPLDAVSNFRATATTHDSVTLGWDAPASTTVIEECHSASCIDPTQVATAAASATSHAVTGLTADTPYYYRITARATADSDYRDSEPSALLAVTTLGAPSDKTPLDTVELVRIVTLAHDTIMLGWGAPASATGLAGFLIESCPSKSSCISPTRVATAAAAATGRIMTGLTAGTPYHYRVRARATAGSDYRDSEPSVIRTATTLTFPSGKTPLDAVSNFRVVAATETTATLAWDAPASTTGLGGFGIEGCLSAPVCVETELCGVRMVERDEYTP